MLLVGFLAVPIFYCLAQDGEAASDQSYGLNEVAGKAYGKDAADLQTDPTVIAGIIVGTVLSLLGIIFLVQVIIAGITWMTAQGNEEKITKAKQTILHSIIGLVIVIAAYVLVNYVMDLLVSATTKTTAQ